MKDKIEQEELLQKSKEFKLFSGPSLTRVFNKTGVVGYEIGTLGSAGLLKYKDRFFVVTAKHVVTLGNELLPLSDIVIPYQYQGGTKALTLLKQAVDSDRDIAIFEVAQTSAVFLEQEQNKCFLEDGLINEDPLGYFENKSNVVFLHGISKEGTDVDYGAFVVDMTTTPYTTFIDRVDEASQRIVLMADVDGTNEFGQTGHPLPDFGGMSGSFAYSYQREDIEIPFRLLGILSNGNKEAGFLWVIPISEVVEILEKEFFGN